MSDNDKRVKRIQGYIDYCGYTLTVFDIINGYTNIKNGKYECHSVNDCVNACGDIIKHWIKEEEEEQR